MSKLYVLIALFGSSSANFPPFHPYQTVPVDRKNWPGAILTNDVPVMPKPSSFVDDEFDPILNYSYRYNTLSQTDAKRFSGKPISLAMLQSKAEADASDDEEENV